MIRSFALLLLLVALVHLAAPAAAQEPEPATDPLAERVAELLADLGSEEFAVRQAAYRELRLLAPRATEILKGYVDHPDPEVARLIGQIVDRQNKERQDALLAPLDTQDPAFPESEEMARILARGRSILDALHEVLDAEDSHYPQYSYWRMRNTYAAIGALTRNQDLPRLLARMSHPNIQHRLLLQPILESGAVDLNLVLREFRARLADPKANGRIRAQILEMCRSSQMVRNETWLPKLAATLLEDPSPEVRVAAVRWFGLRRDEAMLAKIVERTADEDPTVRTEALRALRFYPGPETERRIRAGLADPAAEVRSAAIETLRYCSGPELAPVIRPFLKDPDLSVRAQAARTLGQMEDRASLPALIELLGLRDEDFLGQGLHAVVDALARIGDPASLPALEKLLGDASRYRRIETYRYHIVSAIVRIGGADVLDRIKSHILDPTMQNGHMVLDAMAEIDSDKVIPYLMAALEEGDTRYRTSAVRGLAARRHRAAGPLLRKVMAEEEDPWFLSEALRALVSFGDDPGPETVLNMLKFDPADNRNINLIYAAIRAATRFRIKEAAPAIAAILEAEGDRYGYRAADALGRLGDASVVPVLTERLEAEKYSSRKHRLALALARLGEGGPLLALLEEMPEEPAAAANAARAEALLALGRREEAVATVNATLAAGNVDANSLYNLACVLSLAGDKDRAIEMLDQSLAERVMYRRQLEEDADLDPLRDDPRFERVLEKAR